MKPKRQLFLLKTGVWAVGLAPTVWLLVGFLRRSLGVNPVETIILVQGRWTLAFLLATLAVTPIRRLTGWNRVIQVRRLLGLFAFFHACVHFLAYVGLDQLFELGVILEDIVERRYITVGFLSLVILVPLAVTSTKGWIRRLGKKWQLLHRLVYVAAALGVLHFFWKVKADTFWPLVAALLLAGLFAVRWLVRKKKKKLTAASLPLTLGPLVLLLTILATITSDPPSGFSEVESVAISAVSLVTTSTPSTPRQADLTQPALFLGGYRGKGGVTNATYGPVAPPQRVPSEWHEFYFTRAAYTSRGRGWGRPRWAIDYPKADIQFLTVLKRLTNLDAFDYENAVLLTDDQLRRYPFLYALEVGSINLSPEEITGLRNYLLAGGFLVIDDFWGSWEWAQFEYQMSLVFPGRPIIDLEADHPVFSTFYDIDEVLQVPAYRRSYSGGTYEQDGYTPYVRGIEDDNGRLMMIINWNTDLGDAWEWAEQPDYPLEYSTFAFQMGVNMIIYAMSH